MYTHTQYLYISQGRYQKKTAKDIQTDGPTGNLSHDTAEEERLVREAVLRCNGNISAAAKSLGISRPTLYAKMKKYGL